MDYGSVPPSWQRQLPTAKWTYIRGLRAAVTMHL
jgi:hypothetical protein